MFRGNLVELLDDLMKEDFNSLESIYNKQINTPAKLENYNRKYYVKPVTNYSFSITRSYDDCFSLTPLKTSILLKDFNSFDAPATVIRIAFEDNLINRLDKEEAFIVKKNINYVAQEMIKSLLETIKYNSNSTVIGETFLTFKRAGTNNEFFRLLEDGTIELRLYSNVVIVD